MEEAEADDGFYLMFLAHLQRYGIGETPFDRLPEMLRSTTSGFVSGASATCSSTSPSPSD